MCSFTTFFLCNTFTMEKTVNIEKAICKDATDIHDVNKQSLPVCYSPREYIVFILDEKVILLKAICDNKIVGYALAKWYSNTRLHIMSFAVLEASRGKGAGKLLIDKIREYGLINKDFAQLTLYVQKSNTTALKFYENNKFTKNSYLKNYYGIKDHGYYMVNNVNVV